MGMSLVSLDTVSVDESSCAFNAYRMHRSLERMQIVARRVWETRATSGSFAGCEVDDLRTALYLTQRGWHGHMAIEVDVGIEWELVEAIAVSRLVRDD